MKYALALALLALGGCIEIANVESFVTLPKDAVSFGVQGKTQNER